MYCNPNILFLIWMDGKSQLVCPTEGWFPLARRAEATSCLCLLFPLQREPFGDSNPGRDAESTSPGEKSCLRLQKAYLQQAVLVTFIKIEHWAFLLPCFLCFWQEVVIVKHWLHCAQRCGESLAVHCHGEDKRGETVGRKTHLFFPRDPGMFYRLWRSVSGRSRETCYVTEFPQPLILNSTPSSSIRGSVVSGGPVCHNLLGMVRSRCWRRGQKINKLDWAARPRGRSPYPGLRGAESTLLYQASLFFRRLVHQIEFHQKVSTKKGRYIAYGFCIPETLNLPSRQICNQI